MQIVLELACTEQCRSAQQRITCRSGIPGGLKLIWPNRNRAQLLVPCILDITPFVSPKDCSFNIKVLIIGDEWALKQTTISWIGDQLGHRGDIRWYWPFLQVWLDTWNLWINAGTTSYHEKPFPRFPVVYLQCRTWVSIFPKFSPPVLGSIC